MEWATHGFFSFLVIWDNEMQNTCDLSAKVSSVFIATAYTFINRRLRGLKLTKHEFLCRGFRCYRLRFGRFAKVEGGVLNSSLVDFFFVWDKVVPDTSDLFTAGLIRFHPPCLHTH